ncbi:DUF4886 domain-containing protein [Sphingobacterium sp. SGG-5]|uniref:DUF4886 domain-containing protein n=1 Tax=Sphingobacterium sp. SGG-5 TaxID=2710881 RepID=UPI0013ECDF7F|nr:DUF4886 domain-containing protein [Sphingobacterium sp. SGG-5]NGM60698.1 DUF4886 domain-containing protein [Sphingobacterium sp. SGG-5]
MSVLRLLIPVFAIMAILACSNKEIDPITDPIDDDNANNKPPVAVFQVSLDKYKTTLYKGESTSLVSHIFPEVAENKKITWASSDEAIATVDETGKVTAVAAGEATITATSEDQNKTATCHVVVTDTYNVLFIGNSFTQDAIENHFLSLITTAGLKDKINLHWMHLGGRTMAQHSAAYIIGSADYYYNIPNYNTLKWTNTGLTPLPQTAAAYEWNLVTIQEHTGNKDAWAWDKYHKDNIESLIKNITNDQKGAPAFMYVMAVAYGDPAFPDIQSYSGKQSILQNNFGSDQILMYNTIADRAKKVLSETSVDGVIATGTMLQNLRTTSVNNNTSLLLPRADLTRDSYHMDKGISRFGAACTFFESIFTPIFGAKVPVPYTDLDGSVSLTVDYRTPVTTENAAIALEAARNAVEKPFEITDMSDL